MPGRANAQFNEDALVELAFRDLHLSRSAWSIEVLLARNWMGLKVGRARGRIVERSATFTVKTSAADRTKRFLELVRSAVDELSADPG
jgi:hypothetical protein